LEQGSFPSLSSPPATAASATQPAVAEDRIYEVQPGDNYWSISKAFYNSGRYFGALAQYNAHRIPSPEKMKPGMKVLIPDALVLHQRFPKLVGSAEAKPVLPTGFFVDEQGQPAYRVGSGDTLGGIAQLHLGRVSRAGQLYGMNKDRIRDPNNLTLGTVLRLPADASQIQMATGP
jgi:nucleoid-associated protein YgaU